MERDRMDRRDLAEKVAWEGGVFATLRYGVRSEDINDPEVRTLWQQMERHYLAITPIAARIATELDRTA